MTTRNLRRPKALDDLVTRYVPVALTPAEPVLDELTARLLFEPARGVA